LLDTFEIKELTESIPDKRQKFGLANNAMVASKLEKPVATAPLSAAFMEPCPEKLLGVAKVADEPALSPSSSTYINPSECVDPLPTRQY
jgi:hypothetical protein